MATISLGAALSVETASTIAMAAAAAQPASPSAPVATTASSPAADGTSAAATGATSEQLQQQADQLASQIRAQSVQINQLAEQADGAQLQQQRATVELRKAKVTMALTDRELAAARKTLQAQAVAAYMDDGRSTLGKLVALAGSNPALADGYAQVVAGGEQLAIHQYQDLEHAQIQAAATLTSTQAQAAASVTQLRLAQQAAKEAQASEERTLSQVNGQLTALVTAAETQQAQTESQQEKAALAAAGDLPAASVAIVPATSPATAIPSGSTGAPTTAPGATTSPAPSPTSPSTTVAAAPTTTPAAPTTTPTTSAPTTTGSTTPTTTPSTPPTTTGSPNAPAPNANVAIAWAEAQIGKPYQWGGAGPNSFDCSGLVMDAWGAAGVSFPHLAQDQYAMTTPVSISQLLPGDLVFFGTPSDVYHVGIYVGGGEMVDAPETGQNVMIQSIYETDLLSGGRPA